MREQQTMDWSHVLNWTLKEGSHTFPGPDGGTCINEAAIVAAGFRYQSVKSEEDMPPCFSRVIGAYALGLNDGMPHEQRQRLLPYVARLGGTADTDDFERRRATYLAMQAVNVFAARALEEAQVSSYAAACRDARDIEEAAASADAGFATAEQAGRWYPLGARAASASRAAAAAALFAWRSKGYGAAAAAGANAAAAASRAGLWDEALAALDGVLAIGRQSESIPMAVVAERLERGKAPARLIGELYMGRRAHAL